MGMQFYLEQITPEQITTFTRNPAAAYEFYMDGANDEAELAFDNFVAMAQREGLTEAQRARMQETYSQFQALLASVRPVAPKRPQLVSTKRRKFSLEKDWHVLHYALNGTHEGGEEPLASVILGGTILPDHDGVMGYGPLHYLAPEQVKEIAGALSKIDPQALLAKLDKEDAEAKEIYLAHTLDDLNGWAYLPELFQEFQAFYADAAQRGNGMLLSMS